MRLARVPGNHGLPGQIRALRQACRFRRRPAAAVPVAARLRRWLRGGPACAGARDRPVRAAVDVRAGPPGPAQVWPDTGSGPLAGGAGAYLLW
jgi:hypothetical protein